MTGFNRLGYRTGDSRLVSPNPPRCLKRRGNPPLRLTGRIIVPIPFPRPRPTGFSISVPLACPLRDMRNLPAPPEDAAGSAAARFHHRQHHPEHGAASRRSRFLCLHGFRTSAAIMREQVFSKWPDSITSRLDLVFADAPFPAKGKSEVEGVFPPPYYEWFNLTSGKYLHFEESLKYIEDLMIRQGPFDGLMGFSQGAILISGLAGLQAKGHALTRVPKIKNLIIIGGAKFSPPDLAALAFSEKINCPSLHFIGDLDFLREKGEQLLELFVDPMVIRHPNGHTVPRLDDEKSLQTMNAFLQKIEAQVSSL